MKNLELPSGYPAGMKRSRILASLFVSALVQRCVQVVAGGAATDGPKHTFHQAKVLAHR
jgi:hypothetical protein